jgi:hypothetical protein
LSVKEGLGQGELDLEIAEVLPPRETLTLAVPNIQVNPTIIVTPAFGLAIAVQAATVGSQNAAVLIQNLHVP